MDRNRHVAIWLRMLAEKEIRLARQSSRMLKVQGKKAADAFTTGGQSYADDVISKGQNDWLKVLIANYALTTKDFIAYTFQQLGAKKFTFQNIVQSYITRKALDKSRLINGTTQELMRTAILKGQQDGLGETEIAKAIQKSVGGAVAEARARTIARTEIHNAASYGMDAAARETELLLTREWVSVHDERTRDAHADADGQIRGMDEPFDVDGESIDMPGEGSAGNSINCRCTVIYTPAASDFAGDNSGEFLDAD
jgi:SPP1 gp7 family putative phage head morphogenesis protein